jgi:hypothetical protein
MRVLASLAGGVIDILAALKAEESKCDNGCQLATACLAAGTALISIFFGSAGSGERPGFLVGLGRFELPT